MSAIFEIYSSAHNIFELENISPSVSFTASETWNVIITNKKC